jgi:hypothetical protein
MIFRVFTVHLLVVALLACPFPCLASAAAGASARGKAAGVEKTCVCRCCCPPPAKEGRPVRPVRSEAGGTCLCHGAVVRPAVEMPSPQATSLAPLAAREPPAIATVHGEFSILLARDTACHFHGIKSGRMLRALRASLLI